MCDGNMEAFVQAIYALVRQFCASMNQFVSHPLIMQMHRHVKIPLACETTYCRCSLAIHLSLEICT